jgi:type II secretory pathway pseudopilin PulG
LSIGTRRPKIIKKSFSIIELLVVLSIIVSIACTLAIKSADFMKISQIDSESSLLCHFLNRAYLWVQLEQKPAHILFENQSKQFSLKIPELQIVKTFSKLDFEKEPKDFCLFPNVAPEKISLTVKGSKKDKALIFDEKMQNFFLKNL